MSISKVLPFQTQSKLVIPCAGKMFYSNMNHEKQVLCLVINKGYIETTSLDSMLVTLDELSSKLVVKVGHIDKIRIKKSGRIVYRQRLYFKSVTDMLILCKRYGIKFELASDFKININNIMNVIDELGKLEYFAKKFDENIDTWLTNCCIVHLHNLLLSLGMFSDLEGRVTKILKGRVGYMDYAPFLSSKYDIIKHTSSVFIEPENRVLEGMYSKPMYTESGDLAIGFTTDNIEKYRKERKSNENKNKR